MRKWVAGCALVGLLWAGAVSAAIKDDLAAPNGGGGAAANGPMIMDLHAIQKAFNTAGPFSETEHFKYDPNATYKLRLRQYMHTTIILPVGERIASYSLGDKVDFHFVPLSENNPALTNIAEVYARYPGADTNLTIIGDSGHIYSFYLRVDSVASKYLPVLLAYVDGKAIGGKVLPKGEVYGPLAPSKEYKPAKHEYLHKLGLVNPADLDYDYKMKDGDMSLAPIRVFSDRHFTYFQFGQHNLNDEHRLPVIYKVVDGYDTPVNTRVVGGTVVAETVSKKWTLRSGDAHLCIDRHK